MGESQIGLSPEPGGSLARGDRMLRHARDAHCGRTGHRRIIVGGNFVHCVECRYWATLTKMGIENGYLWLSHPEMDGPEAIGPDQF